VRDRKTRVFVYGSLMRGEPAHRVLASLPGARRLGRGSIAGRLVDLGEYPGALPVVRRGERVHGELWEVEGRRASLRALDAYEAHDPARPERSLFTRRRVSVRLPSGRVRAWAYLLAGDPRGAAEVPGGDWRAWRRARQARRSRAATRA
jgi:gamma-glutamylcyclotransferase (GGCT)/AIG2-like uncharacterized protein YtfP